MEANEMHDIEQVEEKGGITRRDAFKLAGAVAALGAGLGISVSPTGAEGEPLGPIYVKYELKFYKEMPNGQSELVATFRATGAEERKLLAVGEGRLELKLFQVHYKEQLEYKMHKEPFSSIQWGDGTINLKTKALPAVQK